MLSESQLLAELLSYELHVHTLPAISISCKRSHSTTLTVQYSHINTLALVQPIYRYTFFGSQRYESSCCNRSGNVLILLYCHSNHQAWAHLIRNTVSVHGDKERLCPPLLT